MSENYVNNRRKFGEAMENGSVLIIFSGKLPVKRGDQHYQYAPQRNFYYCTGITRPNLIFVQIKNAKGEVRSRLYLERYDELTAKWDGAALSKETAKEISGVDELWFLDEFERHISQLMIYRTSTTQTVYLDLENRSISAPNTPELDFAARLREKFPTVTLVNAFPMFAKLRVIKEAYEVENLKKAGEITGEAFEAMLANTRPGMMEYEVEAHVDYTYKKNGCKDKAFSTILASGKNACILHYGDNDCRIADGSLVLVDFGAQWNCYSADVSRTFPANGKFTDRQKQLYNIVLGALKLVVNMVKPGVIFSKLNEAVVDYYAIELEKIGLIKDKSEVSKYYYHGVSHMLGLETHCVGGAMDLELAPGMVFTVEPGLYIAEEELGIRIEDDILVTASGAENLTAGIIREADEIEAFMATAKAKA